jgi:hypothetical protein
MGRARGWIVAGVLFGLALLLVAWDVMDYAADTQPFKTAPLGQRWFQLHRESLLLVQPAIERHIAVWLWPPVQRFLEQPAWLAPAVVGVVVALFKLVRRR